MSLQQIKNISMAISYIKSQLSEGMTLAKLALEKIDFTQGQMYTWIPPSTDQDAIKSFKRSIRLSGDEDPDFCRLVHTFIQDPNNAVILQDTITWNVAGEKYERLAAKYNDELYWHIAGSNLSEQDVLYITGMPILPYPWCGFCYSNVSSISRKKLLLDTDFEEIVNKVVGVAVAAFDTRSYVLWWTDTRPLPR